MPPGYKVTLPKSQSPRFPDICVLCGEVRPGSLFRETTHTLGWWTWAFWAFGPRYSVEVPACEPCCRKMRNQRWRRRIVNWTLMIAAVIAAASLLQWYQGRLKKWLAMGLALLFLMPLFIWEYYFPRPFDMTADGDRVDYEFQSLNYTAEFQVLNDLDNTDERMTPSNESAQ